MNRIRNGSRLGLLAAAIIFVAIGVGVVLGANRLIADAAWVAHNHGVIAFVEELEGRLREAESAQRGYLLTGDATYLADYRNAVERLPAVQERLQETVQDNPRLGAHTEALLARVEQRLVQMELTLQRYRMGGLAAAQSAIGREALESSTEVRHLAAALVRIERDLLVTRAASSQDSASRLRELAVLGIPVGLLVILGVYMLLVAEIRRRAEAETGAAQANRRLSEGLESTQRASTEMQSLSRYGSLLQSCVSPEEALQLTQRMLEDLLPAVGGGLYRLRNSQDFLELALAWGDRSASMPATFPVESCWALRRGQPYAAMTPIAGTCPHAVSPGHEAVAGRLCLPLTAQGSQFGLLCLEDPGQEILARENIIHSVAEQLSMALATLSLQDRLREQSIRDPLTGLFNRRYLEESAVRELARSARRSLPLSMLMLDIDHFKAFNDLHGHAGGDALLAQFGQLLASMTRKEDIACRYGGEEFTLILPEADLMAASERAEALRAAVAGLQASHLGQLLPQVTASIGVACYPQHGESAHALMQAADTALYRAKKLGRDRVEVAASLS